MKKLILAIAVFAAVAVSAAEYKFPGWGCTDVELLQEQLELAPNVGWRLTVSTVLECAKALPADFAAACAIVDDVINALTPEATDLERINRKKQYAHATSQFAEELVAYCQANPSNYDSHVAFRHWKTAWARQHIANAILVANITPKQAMDGLSILVTANINNDITDTNMKEMLRKMDLRYTDMLSSDKEKWSDVVAKIRTLLDRYN